MRERRTDAAALSRILREGAAAALGRYGQELPEWEGLLYDPQRPDSPVTEAEIGAHLAAMGSTHPADRERTTRFLLERRLRAEGKLLLVGGEPLSSESLCPFTLHSVEYGSIYFFYQSLKLPDDGPLRRSCARGDAEALRRAFAARGAQLEYRGETIAVGATRHLQLVAEATAAKVQAHEPVRRALRETGRSKLYMGDRDSQALGRAMPFALMVERYRLRSG